MLDVDANLRARKWNSTELSGRVLWAMVQPLFRWSPRPMWAWRRWLLRCFGAKIGQRVLVYPTVRVQIPWNVSIGDETSLGDDVIVYALGPITIGRQATISQGVHLCAGTHDYRRNDMPLVKSSISIGDAVWICADAFIGPDVFVGNLAIVGARAVVMRDVSDSMIVAGNPAEVVRKRPPFSNDGPRGGQGDAADQVAGQELHEQGKAGG